MPFTHAAAVESLRSLDPAYPVPAVLDTLLAPGNERLVDYVAEDPFGAHVFPGDVTDYPPEAFLADLDAQLATTKPYHLWCYIPTCAYRCHFCQYPVVLVKGESDSARERADGWVDRTIAEAKLWLRDVPSLASAPVGEFNVFGGTPSLLPPDSIRRLLDFFRENFGIGPETAVRFEGDPSTFTPEKLELLAELGVTKLSSGVQSFDPPVLEACGRQHSSDQCVDFLRNARSLGFPWVSVDLMYGLLDQTVDSVRRDLDILLENEVTAAVCTKLHLRPYAETRTGVAGEKPAAWQIAGHRERLAQKGHRWPTLGEQYQMREVLAGGLEVNGYTEHPTMYFARDGLGPEVWKSIMVDQERQEAEVAIGLGGSSSCRASEAIADINPASHGQAVSEGRIPLGSATAFSAEAREHRAVVMALTTLRPVRDEVHRARFGGRSLFDGPWRERFAALERRGLLVQDHGLEEIRLTPAGRTLVEAMINDLGDST